MTGGYYCPNCDKEFNIEDGWGLKKTTAICCPKECMAELETKKSDWWQDKVTQIIDSGRKLMRCHNCGIDIVGEVHEGFGEKYIIKPEKCFFCGHKLDWVIKRNRK